MRLDLLADYALFLVELPDEFQVDNKKLREFAWEICYEGDTIPLS